VKIGEVFEKSVIFDEAGARSFAKLAGEFNPNHHDPEFAA
jgi:acyl dehydratase